MMGALPGILLLTVWTSRALAWHGLTNDKFHCWPITADAHNAAPFLSCPGIDIDWLQPPPDSIKAGQPFNVTYHFVIAPAFYPWAVGEGIFDNAGTTGGFSGDSAGAQAWCENTLCPADVSKANVSNCCIYHVNVHSCPLSVVSGGLCGPWIPAQGSIFTHSDVMAGAESTRNWTSSVAGFYQEGLTSVIAHFKVADMHVAVEKTVQVLPKTVCGDAVCESGEGESCDTCPRDCGNCPLQDYEIALLALSIFIVVAVITGVVVYFQYQRRKLLWDESWIVPAEDLIKANADGGQFGSCLSVTTASSVLDGSVNMASAAIKRQLFASVAYANGRQVAVKYVHTSNFQLTKQIRQEVREVRMLEHPNLCRFIGGCVEKDNVCILYEYCPKGSLQDVLQNDAIPLNWSFRFSILTDITRALAHLHKHKVTHGNLKSSNCLVDDRWTCKVTDFGLHTYRTADVTADSGLREEWSRKRLVDRVYRAPETRGKAGVILPASDVYAFAIVMVEVAMKDDIYTNADVDFLADDWKPPLPDLAPATCKTDPDFVCPSPTQYIKLICRCWEDRPEDRPSFESAKKTLQSINPNKLSAVDTMMAMMEKYSKHLESIVEERTQQLQEEKQRTDTLLYSMMPRKVADLLKSGHQVRAEHFDACTIYFSDIVGFTDLSGRSSPIQVVELLNRLYTTFDSIIERHKVYKVETIGDAYMVVSGVPDKTPQHACHVALMSLDMVQASLLFQIPHLPGEPLRIRVGLHSGTVCAGVVGIKMPRYCLFGDTVNTASRMESNGEAYKIHISDNTYQELQQHGNFVCEARGTIPVKGKGEMSTWWLIKTADQNENVKYPGEV